MGCALSDERAISASPRVSGTDSGDGNAASDQRPRRRHSRRRSRMMRAESGRSSRASGVGSDDQALSPRRTESGAGERASVVVGSPQQQQPPRRRSRRRTMTPEEGSLQPPPPPLSDATGSAASPLVANPLASLQSRAFQHECQSASSATQNMSGDTAIPMTATAMATHVAPLRGPPIGRQPSDADASTPLSVPCDTTTGFANEDEANHRNLSLSSGDDRRSRDRGPPSGEVSAEELIMSAELLRMPGSSQQDDNCMDPLSIHRHSGVEGQQVRGVGSAAHAASQRGATNSDAQNRSATTQHHLEQPLGGSATGFSYVAENPLLPPVIPLSYSDSSSDAPATPQQQHNLLHVHKLQWSASRDAAQCERGPGSAVSSHAALSGGGGNGSGSSSSIAHNDGGGAVGGAGVGGGAPLVRSHVFSIDSETERSGQCSPINNSGNLSPPDRARPRGGGSPPPPPVGATAAAEVEGEDRLARFFPGGLAVLPLPLDTQRAQQQQQQQQHQQPPVPPSPPSHQQWRDASSSASTHSATAAATNERKLRTDGAARATQMIASPEVLQTAEGRGWGATSVSSEAENERLAHFFPRSMVNLPLPLDHELTGSTSTRAVGSGTGASGPVPSAPFAPDCSSSRSSPSWAPVDTAEGSGPLIPTTGGAAKAQQEPERADDRGPGRLFPQSLRWLPLPLDTQRQLNGATAAALNVPSNSNSGKGHCDRPVASGSHEVVSSSLGRGGGLGGDGAVGEPTAQAQFRGGPTGTPSQDSMASLHSAPREHSPSLTHELLSKIPSVLGRRDPQHRRRSPPPPPPAPVQQQQQQGGRESCSGVIGEGRGAHHPLSPASSGDAPAQQQPGPPGSHAERQMLDLPSLDLELLHSARESERATLVDARGRHPASGAAPLRPRMTKENSATTTRITSTAGSASDRNCNLLGAPRGDRETQVAHTNASTRAESPLATLGSVPNTSDLGELGDSTHRSELVVQGMMSSIDELIAERGSSADHRARRVFAKGVPCLKAPVVRSNDETSSEPVAGVGSDGSDAPCAVNASGSTQQCDPCGASEAQISEAAVRIRRPEGDAATAAAEDHLSFYGEDAQRRRSSTALPTYGVAEQHEWVDDGMKRNMSLSGPATGGAAGGAKRSGENSAALSVTEPAAGEVAAPLSTAGVDNGRVHTKQPLRHGSGTSTLLEFDDSHFHRHLDVTPEQAAAEFKLAENLITFSSTNTEHAHSASKSLERSAASLLLHPDRPSFLVEYHLARSERLRHLRGGFRLLANEVSNSVTTIPPLLDRWLVMRRELRDHDAGFSQGIHDTSHVTGDGHVYCATATDGAMLPLDAFSLVDATAAMTAFQQQRALQATRGSAAQSNGSSVAGLLTPRARVEMAKRDSPPLVPAAGSERRGRGSGGDRSLNASSGSCDALGDVSWRRASVERLTPRHGSTSAGPASPIGRATTGGCQRGEACGSLGTFLTTNRNVLAEELKMLEEAARCNLYTEVFRIASAMEEVARRVGFERLAVALLQVSLCASDIRIIGKARRTMRKSSAAGVRTMPQELIILMSDISPVTATMQLLVNDLAHSSTVAAMASAAPQSVARSSQGSRSFAGSAPGALETASTSGQQNHGASAESCTSSPVAIPPVRFPASSGQLPPLGAPANNNSNDNHNTGRRSPTCFSSREVRMSRAVEDLGSAAHSTGTSTTTTATAGSAAANSGSTTDGALAQRGSAAPARTGSVVAGVPAVASTATTPHHNRDATGLAATGARLGASLERVTTPFSRGGNTSLSMENLPPPLFAVAGTSGMGARSSGGEGSMELISHHHLLRPSATGYSSGALTNVVSVRAIDASISSSQSRNNLLLLFAAKPLSAVQENPVIGWQRELTELGALVDSELRAVTLREQGALDSSAGSLSGVLVPADHSATDPPVPPLLQSNSVVTMFSNSVETDGFAGSKRSNSGFRYYGEGVTTTVSMIPHGRNDVPLHTSIPQQPHHHPQHLGASRGGGGGGGGTPLRDAPTPSLQRHGSFDSMGEPLEHGLQYQIRSIAEKKNTSSLEGLTSDVVVAEESITAGRPLYRVAAAVQQIISFEARLKTLAEVLSWWMRYSFLVADREIARLGELDMGRIQGQLQHHKNVKR